VQPGFEEIGVYGGGLSTFVVLGVRGSDGRNLIPDAISAGGTPLGVASGPGVVISAPLVNAIIFQPAGFFLTFLMAGTVSTDVLEQAATDLAELVTLS
jgi:hypothetical protein